MERYTFPHPLPPPSLRFSGAMVIDKTRNLAALLIACHLNSQKVRDQITYERFYGDKESYWLAHVLTSSPYHFVPGYSGGIGRISHPLENGSENPDKEQICTLQLLHVLESTQEPFWFNSGIVEEKRNGGADYILPEGWVGHDGRWAGSRRPRFANGYCVQMREGSRDRESGLPEPVHRVEGVFKDLMERIIHAAGVYDRLMEAEGLITINR